ncbi:unnamed protein product [Dimorphilus gyrociliatus]|uniref:G-protein coupled receptors family 1 profile domain-containing protein n=1 Tax=Dimorphilus gyrociliatus TaxID=2664684 RepID=A0A7I8VT60_9ANNE|nr:unnamed protein product [Dimorphilus gyrociliatus]
MNSSTIHNGSDTYYSKLEERIALLIYSYIAPITLACLAIIAIGGNSLVICVILSQSALRTLINFLLLNLALADLLFALTVIPGKIIKYLTVLDNSLQMGNAVCKIYTYLTYTITDITITLLIAISFLRLAIVVYTTQTAKYRSFKNISKLTACIWVLISALHTPLVAVATVKSKGNKYAGIVYCGIDDEYINSVLLSLSIGGYFVPAFLITVVYALIAYHLKNETNDNTIDAAKERTRRALKMMVVVVLVFLLSWLPTHLNTILSMKQIYLKSVWFELLRLLCDILAYGNSCVNPFIYNFMSSEFKTAFRNVVCCRCRNNNNSRPSTRTENIQMSPINNERFLDDMEKECLNLAETAVV